MLSIYSNFMKHIKKFASTANSMQPERYSGTKLEPRIYIEDKDGNRYLIKRMEVDIYANDPTVIISAF